MKTSLRASLTLLLALGGLLGCGSSADEPPADTHAGGEETGEAHAGHHEEGGHHGEGEHHASADAPEPAAILEDGSRLFGTALDETREAVTLSSILEAPADFDGQTVKTEGEIAQVCQSMGCWMEIRTDADSQGIRVPMANHSFFLPRDLAGSRCTVEGTVHVAALSPEEREHLESEGATAADQSLSIEASGVLIHP